MSRSPDIQIFAGGTEIAGIQTTRSLLLNADVASIARIRELRKTSRTEQYLEVGACTTLTGLLGLSLGILPESLASVIHGVANHAVRNIATVGGNLCSRLRFMDLWPILTCLDCQAEIRSAEGSRWVSLWHFADSEGNPAFPKASLLTRLRIPFRSYNFAFVRKLGAPGYPTAENALFVCLANVSRSKVDDFRLAFAGSRAFRSRELELTVSGRKSALSPREIQTLADAFKESYGHREFFEPRFFASLLEEALEGLFG
jgi:CO/xanthine dehydrogenase FAD-binding subunit